MMSCSTYLQYGIDELIRLRSLRAEQSLRKPVPLVNVTIAVTMHKSILKMVELTPREAEQTLSISTLLWK
jgi:hypothetical protein